MLSGEDLYKASQIGVTETDHKRTSLYPTQLERPISLPLIPLQ